MDKKVVLEMLREASELQGKVVYSVRVDTENFRAYVGVSVDHDNYLYVYDVSDDEAWLETIVQEEILLQPQVW